MTFFVALPHRRLIALGGEEPQAFLQGLVSADVLKATADKAVYGAFLTPQGRFLHEFFLAQGPAGLLLETDADGRAPFVQRLSRYNLRRKVTIAAFDDWHAFALFGDGVAEAARRLTGGVVFADPRLAAAGYRAWLPENGPAMLADAGFQPAEFLAWDRFRLALGLPDGARDLVPDKTILLEAGFDELGGADWQKGCYLGQEVTARSKYRGHVRRRMMPVAITGPAPEAGTPVLAGETEIGEMCSQAGSVGLAMLRIESFESGAALRSGEAILVPYKPEWMVF